MKLKLLFVTALMLSFVSPTYAQDPPPDPVPAAVVVADADAGGLVETAPVEAIAVVETPETENGPAVEDVSNAPAPTLAEETALSKLSTEIMNVLIPVFSTLMLGLATLVLNWVRKKFKLQVSDQSIHQWSLIAQKAADRGGEWARNKAKDLTDDKKVPGPEVLEVAVDWAVMAGKQYGLPDMGREKLIGLIEGRLHMNRAAIEA
jgi:hypothetical protein